MKNIVNFFRKKYLVSSRLAPVLHLTPRDWSPSGGAAVAAGVGSGGGGEEAGWPYEVDCREGGQDDWKKKVKLIIFCQSSLITVI